MTRFGHTTSIGALALALMALLVAVPSASAMGAAGAGRHAIVAFVPGVTLDQLADVPGASVSMLGATQGRYRQLQALLDLSQGARTSLAAYSPGEPSPIGVRADGTVAGWDAAVRRAQGAPAMIVPGLLGASVPGGAAWVGQADAPRDSAIAATSRDGRVAELRLVASPARVVPAALGLARRRPLVLARVPDARALDALVRGRPPETLVVALADPPPSLVTRLLPIAVVGLGAGRTLTSATTRTEGLVTATDIAPTVLRWLALPIPTTMNGQAIVLDGALDVGALRDLQARLAVVTTRRYATLGYLAVAWALLALAASAAGRRGGWRWAVRCGALGVLWLLPVLLVFAALASGARTEELGVALAVLALGALTDRLVRWPLAPAVPTLVGVGSYIVDLAFGSPLIVRSLLGPNPLFGSRFYGIGNELEATLPVLALCGVAAWAVALGRGERSRTLALAFAATGLVLGVAIGAGRLGADVGGVVTVGCGTAVAVLLALPGPITGRRVALAVAVPVLGLVALALLDLATGGNGHFTRTVLRASSDEALEDVFRRRYELAWNNLSAGVTPLLTALALAAIAWGVWRRDRLLARVPGAPAWGAALAGSAAGGVAGALSNDSGPLLVILATFGVAWVAAYLRAPGETKSTRSMV
jgi:hypothetical protein